MESARELRFGPFRLDAVDERLWRGSEEIALSPRPFAMLRYLAEHPGRLVTKEDLLEVVWGGVHVTSTSPRVCLHEIREALGEDASAPRFIETVPRRGYRFLAPVSVVAPSDAPARLPAERNAGDLVGRDAELERLDRWLADAIAGERRLVFVTGEAGIGKTTLVDAFSARHAPSVRLARGQCIEHYGTPEAYLPVLEAFTRLCRAPGGEAVVEILARHAPLWLAQMPSVASASDRATLGARVAGATPERMLREMADAIEEIGHRSPLVLWLEDLHGSDHATLDLLAFVARRREPARLLVIGTYRPSVVRTGEHPLWAIQQELQVRGWCHELALAPLSKEGVAAYLSTRAELRATDESAIRDAADLIHARTDGNPLFLVSTVGAVLERGVDAGNFLGVTRDVCREVPPNVREFLEQQIEHLPREDRRLLEAASVAGMELAAASVAAGLEEPLEDVEARLGELARRGSLLEAGETAEWPDGTVAASFRFAHALHQEVLYRRVTTARRIGLHRRIGERLERGWVAKTEEIAPELAVHFERGGEPGRAIDALHAAGARAMRGYAPREAEAFLRSGLRLLESLPAGALRDRRELALRIALGPALSTTRGYADPAVEETYARASELCAGLDAAPEIFPVLRGSWMYAMVRGELARALELGRRLLVLAESARDPAKLLEAHQAIAVTSHFLGDWSGAMEHAGRGLELYDRRTRREVAVAFADDPGVMCLVTQAAALWALGFPERGIARAEEAIGLARELGHPLSLGIALISLVFLSQECRPEDPVAKERLEEAIDLFTVQGLTMMLAIARVCDAHIRARRSAFRAAAIEQMREAIAAFEATGARWLRPHFDAWLARTLAGDGRIDAGLAVIERTLGEAGAVGDGFFTAELWRLRGELLGRKRGRAAGARAAESEIEASFEKALATARRQGARSLELRAVVDLARLHAAKGRKAEARRLLADVLECFPSAFETDDLRAARTLLKELGARGRRLGGNPPFESVSLTRK